MKTIICAPIFGETAGAGGGEDGLAGAFEEGGNGGKAGLHLAEMSRNAVKSCSKTFLLFNCLWYF